MAEEIKNDSEKYDENGQLLEKYSDKDGELDGPYEEYDENGQLCDKCFDRDGTEVTEEEYNRLTQNALAQIVEDKSEEKDTVENTQNKSDEKGTPAVIEAQTDDKATSEVLSDKSDKNSQSRKSRAEMRAEMMELQESARHHAITLSMTSDTRHALAVTLNNLRHEFGCAAKKVAVHSKTVKALYEKMENDYYYRY